MNYQNNGVVIICNNKILINGKEIPNPPVKNFNNQTIINNKVFINGYEYKNGKWKKTLRALFHKYF